MTPEKRVYLSILPLPCLTLHYFSFLLITTRQRRMLRRMGVPPPPPERRRPGRRKHGCFFFVRDRALRRNRRPYRRQYCQVKLCDGGDSDGNEKTDVLQGTSNYKY